MVDFERYDSEMVRRAYEVAKEAHRGQVDKAGADYILHPMTVASFVEGDELAMVVALLHDVVEDTEVSIEDLSRIFPEEVMQALDLLTHREGDAYMDYVKKIKESGNAVALKVKLADLRNNMDLSRLPEVRQKDIDRLEKKYKPALEYLLS